MTRRVVVSNIQRLGVLVLMVLVDSNLGTKSSTTTRAATAFVHKQTFVRQPLKMRALNSPSNHFGWIKERAMIGRR